jgi:hypothetical protein
VTNSTPSPPTSSPSETDDGLAVPTFLLVANRQPLTAEQRARLDAAMTAARAPHQAHADDLRAMQRETKRQKSLVRIEKLLAKKSGAAALMPISGKQAISFINSVSSNRTKTARGLGQLRNGRARR